MADAAPVASELIPELRTRRGATFGGGLPRVRGKYKPVRERVRRHNRLEAVLRER
jgi:hypothetical protein